MKQTVLACICLLGVNAMAAPTAFVNVDVLTMLAAEPVPDQTVITRNGLVEVIGAVDTVPIPEDALVVDGTDRYLMPGLAEMHAHVPAAGAPSLQRVLALFVASGVTTMRGMLGHPSHLALREQLAASAVFGPRLVTSGPSLNGGTVSGAADGARQVRAQHAAGYDFIKIHPGLTAAEFEAITTTAAELGIPVAGHVPVAVGVERALAAGIATIDHLDGYLLALLPADADPSGGYGGFFDVLLADQLVEQRIDAIARASATAGTWNVPTQSLFEHRVGALTAAELSAREEMRYMPAATVAQWVDVRNRQDQERGYSPEIGAQAIRIRRELIAALHAAGAGLLLGSDAPQVFNVPGYSIHHELAALVAAGLSPFEALQTGTTAVAEFLGSNTGVVAVGRDADLVLLDANPLVDIGNSRRVHGVMLRGTWYPGNVLRQRLAAFRRSD